MSFKVNDRVVYPHHGAAIIRKSMVVEFNGDKADYFEIEMVHDGLTVSVPVEKLEELGIRSPVSLDEVDEIMAMLTVKDVREPTNWSRRFKNHQEKLKSGDVFDVAEVVRNLSLRDQGKGLSAGEKSLFSKARTILVSELAFAMDVTEEAATEAVDAQLVKDPVTA